MIIGFAHLTYATDASDKSDYVLNNVLKAVSFEGVPNNPAKQKLMRTASETHDLAINKTVSPTTEIVKYPIIHNRHQSPISLDDKRIILSVSNQSTERAFFEKLGCRVISNTQLALQSPISSWNVEIEIMKSDQNKDYYLDDKGFVALAFYTRNIDRLLQELSQYQASELFEQQLDRLMRICFLRTPNGIYIEIIEV